MNLFNTYVGVFNVSIDLEFLKKVNIDHKRWTNEKRTD